MKLGCFRLVFILLTGLFLSACANSNFAMPDWLSSSDETEQAPAVQQNKPAAIDEGALFREKLKAKVARNGAPQPQQNQQDMVVYRTPNTLYSPSFSHKSLADYAEQLTMNLIHNGRNLPLDSLVGVTTFVNFDQSLNNSSALGNQLAEQLMSEMQSYGVAVADFKAMDQIMVNSAGDFVFSRQAQQLSSSMSVSYVLSGTLIRNEKGVRVNARVVDIQSKRVVSSASLVIPHFVVKSLQPSYLVVRTD